MENIAEMAQMGASALRQVFKTWIGSSNEHFFINHLGQGSRGIRSMSHVHQKKKRSGTWASDLASPTVTDNNLLRLQLPPSDFLIYRPDTQLLCF
jgi:hypothetical protein